MNLNEAKETTVFEIEDGVIKEVNLYDKMSRSVEECCSPRGVMPRYFMEGEEDEEDERSYCVSMWRKGDNRYQTIETNLTLDEAEASLFHKLEIDFDADWDNSCNIFYTFEEAEQTQADRINVDVEVYRSISKKEVIIKEAKFIRKEVARNKQEKVFNDMANMYASQVLRVPFESKHDTEVRVSTLFGRIDKNVFWRVINKVRAEQNQR